MKPSEVKHKVEKVLKQSTLARDCDFKLVALVHRQEMADLRISFSKYLNAMYHGRLTPVASIIRCRRKLQNLHEELRGKNYAERQNELEQETREDIKTKERWDEKTPENH